METLPLNLPILNPFLLGVGWGHSRQRDLLNELGEQSPSPCVGQYRGIQDGSETTGG